MTALECTSREAAGDRQSTLGQIITRNRDLFPKPLDSALEKMWGYASETWRHLKEGNTPDRAEAELVVRVSASLSAYLASRLGQT